ncbi:hypothetical protein [Streptomyces acidicola]|uniref:hypothetical protein n=1 Tax=Streptomyces acidicola TaxID=2596892 RepID=UPI00382EFBDA
MPFTDVSSVKHALVESGWSRLTPSEGTAHAIDRRLFGQARLDEALDKADR